ncbi:MAG: putative DNA-binding transcriptional regulator YafY [Myxococcota bacterium]|jgi:predicted DNA-binding transcriptional regulator YafY
MRRADRLFQIVQLLRARRMLTAEQLAEHLRVSKRTIYRDIQDLQGSGVPVRGEAGVGYCLERGYDLPPMTFNTAELEALVSGIRVMEAWGDANMADAARSALMKIEAVLPRGLREVLIQTPIYAPTVHWAETATANMTLLREAIHARSKLQLSYVGGDGSASERVVCPVGLYFWGRTWSLAAWCELRDDWRSFRLDRVNSLSMLADRFDDVDGITAAAFHDSRAVEARPVCRVDAS